MNTLTVLLVCSLQYVCVPKQETVVFECKLKDEKVFAQSLQKAEAVEQCKMLPQVKDQIVRTSLPLQSR